MIHQRHTIRPVTNCDQLMLITGLLHCLVLSPNPLRVLYNTTYPELQFSVSDAALCVCLSLWHGWCPFHQQLSDPSRWKVHCWFAASQLFSRWVWSLGWIHGTWLPGSVALHSHPPLQCSRSWWHYPVHSPQSLSPEINRVFFGNVLPMQQKHLRDKWQNFHDFVNVW